MSFAISKVARIEDVYEGFSGFLSILEFLAVGPKPARNTSLLILSLSLHIGNPYIGIPYMEAEDEDEEGYIPSWLGPEVCKEEFQDLAEIVKSFVHVFNPSHLGNRE